MEICPVLGSWHCSLKLSKILLKLWLLLILCICCCFCVLSVGFQPVFEILDFAPSAGRVVVPILRP